MTAARGVLFDLDRTLVRIDTSVLYDRYRRRRGEGSRLHSARVAYWLLQHKLGFLDLREAVEKTYLQFKGHTEESLFAIGLAWFEAGVKQHIPDAARATVRRHRERGDLLAIVTGQTSYLASPVAKELGIEHVVTTRLEVQAGRVTGKVLEPVGYGPGKVALAEALASEHGFRLEEATFYSDSASDLPLLQRVGTPIAVNPDSRLRKVAVSKRWTIETW